MSRELASWLRYYRQLGFTHLYRRKEGIPQITQISQINESEPQPKGSGPFGSQPLPFNRGSDSVLPTSAQSGASVAQQPGSLFAALAPRETLEQIRQDLGDCRRCKLWKGRKSIVFGSGNPKAQLVFVGEGPGADEDEQGLPFVGRAGQLLTEMIEKGMKIPRAEVYICNIIKCRPPDNRKPEKDEVAACRQFVERQLDALQPRVICALGATAAETLLGTHQSMGALRGHWFEFHGIPLLVTYHPAFLLRDPTKKRDAWEDLKAILAYLKGSDR